MKKLLIVSAISLLILAGCSQQGLSQSELFEKKQECAGYKTKILDNRFTTDHPSNLLDLFYSPKLNTCVFGGREVIDGTTYRIVYDYFEPTGKSLFYCSDAEDIKCSENYDSEIKTLKGE